MGQPTLEDFRPKVELAIRDRLRALEREAGVISPKIRPYYRLATEYALRGGKRFRALLLILGYLVAGGQDPLSVVPAAAALETFQDWMLIHDDIMDHAATRRGGPALHAAYADVHRDHGYLNVPAEFGNAMAIIMGDAFEPPTIEGLVAAIPSGANPAVIALEYARMARLTAMGQMLDMVNSVNPISRVTEKDVLTVHRLKSATYTVVSPLRIGGALASAHPQTMRLFSEFGEAVGIAFQLRDDVIGVEGAEPGKDAKSKNDLQEGKRTVLVTHAWARANHAQRVILRRVVGKETATQSEVDSAVAILRSTGAFAHSEDLTSKLYRQAVARVADAAWLDASAKSMLRDMAKRLVDRSF